MAHQKKQKQKQGQEMKNYTVSLAIKIPANWQVDVKAKNESEAKRKALKAFEQNDGENIEIEELKGYEFEDIDAAFDSKTKTGIAIIDEF